MTTSPALPGSRLRRAYRTVLRDLRKHWFLYLMFVPVLAFYITFCYRPLYGAQIAFKNFVPARGIQGSPWVGLYHFQAFFSSIYIGRLIRNTVLISVYSLAFGFPAPIILALLMNELRSDRFKRVVQTTTYLPHFISTIVICGMILEFTSSAGVVNTFVALLGGQRVTMLVHPQYFRPVYVISGIWQEVGFGSIIYLAALTGIDPEYYDAACVDGANRWHRLLHVTLPGIAPTVTILLILRIGQIMNVGYEKIILLYNGNTMETADVISTFVYRRGLLEFNYSYSSAVGLFNSAINFTLLIAANAISRRIGENSLW